VAAQRAGGGTLLWAADGWMADALVERLGAAHGCVAVLTPDVAAEQGGPAERRWTLPAPQGTDAIDCVAPVLAGLGRVESAVVETALVGDGGAADWGRALGDRLWRSLAVARQVALRMQDAGGGRIALVAVDRASGVAPPEADVARAGVVTMAHGLAKAVGDGVRVCALLSGPVEEARRSGQRSRTAATAPVVADFVAGLLESRAWSTGSIFHVDAA